MRLLLYILAAVNYHDCIFLRRIGPVREGPYLSRHDELLPRASKTRGAGNSLPEQSKELRSSLWPSRSGFNYTPDPRYTPAMDSLNIKIASIASSFD